MSIPKPKKPTRKAIVKQLDTAFSKYIRARDRACVNCGTLDNPTCGHVFSRAAYSTRWDEDNAFKQCVSCNLRHEFDSYPLMEHARKALGQERYDELHRRYATTKKFSNTDLLELTEHYQGLLDDLVV